MLKIKREDFKKEVPETRNEHATRLHPKKFHQTRGVVHKPSFPEHLSRTPAEQKLPPLPSCLMPFPSHQGAGAFSPLNGSS